VLQVITGGAGFIGSHLTRDLLKSGEQVRIFDDFSTGRRSNLADIATDVEILDGDLRDIGAVANVLRGAEVVYHHAAIPSVHRSVADPRTTMDVGIAGTLNVLLAAREANCRRIVLASSSAVYGDNPASPKREDMAPSPLSPYAVSKLADEHLCQVFHRIYGLETVALRYFNVYGPNQDPHSHYAAAIPKFIDAFKHGVQPTIFGDGNQTRDFVFVEDVVRANRLAAATPDAAGQVFNVACQQATSVNLLVHLIAEYFGLNSSPRYRPASPGEVLHSLADISLAKQVLGYHPRVSIAEGIAMTIEAMS